MANKFNLKVITQTRVAYEGETEVVVLPGLMGELAIMSDHMPLIVSLAPGLMTIKNEGEDRVASVFGGFAEVVDNRVTVAASDFHWPDEVDKARAQRALETAERTASEATSDLEVKRAQLAMRRANVRLELSAYVADKGRSVSGS
ncbi:MAG: ATP synthase F1 subunit epsilon [Defluviitaleaceae bacterium]|nr:ATP synthase F1 subunit epsilon [Defluviitaleaceae bacterium]